MIVKSISKSEKLELNNEGRLVRLKGDLIKRDQAEIDECTIYIEQIPLNSDHDSIKCIFSKYGTINYISLPRYKQSRQLKQFGFIEFAQKESVQKCIDEFKKFEGVLYCSKGEKLLSISTFDNEGKGEKSEDIKNDKSGGLNKEASKNESGEKDVEMKDKDQIDDKKKTKSDDQQIESKSEEKIVIISKSGLESTKTNLPTHTDDSKFKLKTTSDVQNIDLETGPDDEESNPTENPEDKLELGSEASSSNEDPETDKPKKKNRKHKRKNKKQKIIDERAVTMKIMRKTLWKKLRNEYLNLERQKAKEIKKILQETRKVSPKETLSKLSPRISFYKSPRSDQDGHELINEEHNESENTGPIVNIKFREPCNDLKELRQEFRQFSYVQHVDIVEGGAQCNVRVAGHSYAQELVNLYSGCEYEANIISGDAEKEYWKRITENKERNKRKSEDNPNRKQRRGREKLAKMIMKASAQHIRFNDNIEVVE